MRYRLVVREVWGGGGSYRRVIVRVVGLLFFCILFAIVFVSSKSVKGIFRIRNKLFNND